MSAAVVESRLTTDRPALGALLAREDVQERRRRMRWLSECCRADYAARIGALRRLVAIHEAIRIGRRLDRVARELRALADELDTIDQPVTGGWNVGRWPR